MIEADLQGNTLVVTGQGIADFRAYAPAATEVRINRQSAAASVVDGVVIYPPLPPGDASDGGFIERPLFVAGFNRGILGRRVSEKPLDAFPHAGGRRSVV